MQNHFNPYVRLYYQSEIQLVFIFLIYPPCIIKPCESYQWNIHQKHPEPYANSRQESIYNTDWTYKTLTSL